MHQDYPADTCRKIRQSRLFCVVNLRNFAGIGPGTWEQLSFTTLVKGETSCNKRILSMSVAELNTRN